MQDELYDIIDGFWQKVIDEIVTNLYQANRVASGALAQAVGGYENTAIPVTVIGQGFEVTIAMLPYWIYVDEGVSGAINNKGISQFKYTNDKPPVSAIRKFMMNRGIVGEDYAAAKRTSGRARQRNIGKALNSVAYAIAYKIWRDGLPKTNFFSDVVNEKLLTKFENEIVNEYSKLIIDLIELK